MTTTSANCWSLTLRHEGWAVTAARSGAEALAALRQHGPAAALIDFQLPDMNGLD